MTTLHTLTSGFAHRARLHKSRLKTREDGMVAIEFVASLCFLLLPITLLVLSIPTWAERQMLARTAARESARVYALTGDPATATAMAQQVAANYKIPDTDLTVSFDDYPAVPIKPGDTANATVTVKVPAISVGILKVDSSAFDYSSTHNEPIDVYRSRAQ